MSRYTIQTPEGRKLTIEADSEADAIRGAQNWSLQQKSASAPARKASNQSAPKAPPKRTWMDDVTGVMANFNRGLALGDEAAALFATAGDALTGQAPEGLLGSYERNLGRQRGFEDTFTASNPKTAALARGTGMAANAGLTAALPAAPIINAARGSNVARGATLGALDTAGYALADRGSIGERVKAATDVPNLALGAVIGGTAGIMQPGRPRQQTQRQADVAALRERGVPLTPGQAGGRIAQTVENAMTSAPIVGPRIADAQRRSIEGFNRATLNDALDVVGQRLPDGIEPGQESIRHTRQALNRVYLDLRPEGGVALDNQAAQEIADAIENVFPTLGDTAQQRLLNIVDQRVSQPSQAAQSQLDADLFQYIEQKLDYEIGRHTRSADPDQNAIGQALEGVRESLRSAAARQNPAYAEGKQLADRAWATFARARDAADVGNAEVSATGIFTPADYLRSVRRAEDNVGRVAEGQSLGQDLGAMAQRVLPNKLPNSGTADRAALTGGLGGLGVMALSNPVGAVGTGLAYTAGATAASAPYTRLGQELFNRALDRNISASVRRRNLDALRQIASRSPEAQRLYQEALRLSGAAAGPAVVGLQMQGEEQP